MARRSLLTSLPSHSNDFEISGVTLFPRSCDHKRDEDSNYATAIKAMHSKASTLLLTVLTCLARSSLAFVPTLPTFVAASRVNTISSSAVYVFNNNKKKTPESKAGPKKTLSGSRREKLGIGDDEDEYDLGVALANNTDPFITKVIAGSFILVVMALLVAGIIVPALTDYGEGVCRPLLTGGRC
eukprot:scaffold1194_cov127-Cylindrotheca_fusiformis.AAC.12